MDLVKNYPWAKSLGVLEKDFKKWQAESAGESFAFWSLQNKVIRQKNYFDWAVDHYQIPFLEDMFFERHLLKKTEWEKLEDMADWTIEKLPVAVWKGAVFIGCVEAPLAEKPSFNFKYQFVLTSHVSLQTIWNFTQELSRAIKEEKLEDSSPVTDTTKVLSSSKKKASPLKMEKNFTPDIPSDKNLHRPDPIRQPLLKVVAKEDSKTKNTVKANSSLPEPEEKRDAGLENSMFTGHSPKKEGDNLIKGNFKPKTSVKTKPTLNQQAEDSSLKAHSLTSKAETHTHLTQSRGGESTYTGILSRSNEGINYEKLWEQTKPVFVASIVANVTEDKIYPSVWSGRVKIEQTDKELIDLKAHSLFKVLQRGHPYHGFVVQLPANKEFFSEIGWEKYPEHVSAIPIKNEKQELKQIFIGLSVNPLHRDKISFIEKIVFDFFQSQKRNLSQVA